MQELWQLFDPQGRPITGRGASKADIFNDGLLHGASHVWIWRANNGTPEILLQKRAAQKRTWPNLYDISAAGHIDLSESPLSAALRETYEEIGVTVREADLLLFGVQKVYMIAGDGSIENEFQWLFLLKLPDNIEFQIQTEEVALLKWKSLDNFRREIRESDNQYVPHGNLYFETVISSIERELVKP